MIIRGLYLNGLGGDRGIFFTGGATLHVENCVLTGFTIQGMRVEVAGADVYVQNTISRQNGGAGFSFVSPSSLIRASLTSVRSEKNSFGIVGGTNSRIVVTRSVAAANGTGFYASAGEVTLDSCAAIHNATGVFADGNGTARVANSFISANDTGIGNSPGATTISFGNNRLDGNTTNGTFVTMVAKQ